LTMFVAQGAAEYVSVLYVAMSLNPVLPATCVFERRASRFRV